MFGTSLIMRPRQVTRPVKSTELRRRRRTRRRRTATVNPVALTTMSAGISAPELTRIPCSVNVSMVSVTIDAVVAQRGEQVPVRYHGDALSNT